MYLNCALKASTGPSPPNLCQCPCGLSALSCNYQFFSPLFCLRDFHLSLKYHEEKVAQELKQRLGKKRDACIMLHQNLKCLLTRGVTYRHHEQLPQWPQLMDRLACRLRRGEVASALSTTGLLQCALLLRDSLTGA